LTDMDFATILTCPVAIYIAVTIFAAWALFPPILPAIADPKTMRVKIKRNFYFNKMKFHQAGQIEN